MKKIIISIIILSTLFSVNAADYLPLEPSLNTFLKVPGATASEYTLGFSTDPNKKISNTDWMNVLWGGMFLSIFILAAFEGGKAAIVFISPDSSPEKRRQGKDSLKRVIIGVVFVLAVWPLLYWLRPSMLSKEISLPKAPASTYTSTQTNSNVSSGSVTVIGDTTNRANLASKGITVNKDNCTQTQWNVGIENKIPPPGCTSLEELPEETINMLLSLKNDCDKLVKSCIIVITGGTEPGHAPNGCHGKGKPCVDLRCSGDKTNGCSDSTTELYKFITGVNPGMGIGGINKSWCYKGKAYGPYKGFYFCNEDISATNSDAYHWHVFK